MFKTERTPPRVSFCTTCMGRLAHIKKTLIRNIEANLAFFPHVEFVLLDYNSQDGLEEWVSKSAKRYIDYGILNYYKTTEPTHFKMSHSKNVAALLSTGSVLVNLDADNYTGVGFAEENAKIFTANPDNFVRCGRSGGDLGCGGRIGVWRDNFLKLGGYEENMMGWGLEDGDLRQRARRLGLRYFTYEPLYCRAVFHDDADREAHHTPPGEQHLTLGESSSRNRAIFLENTRRGIIEANKGKIWGKASVIKNFKHRLDVASSLERGFELEKPKTAQPVVPESLHVPGMQFVPQNRSVGHFRLSLNKCEQANRRI